MGAGPISLRGQRVYAPRYRAEWLAKIKRSGVPPREVYCQQLDALRSKTREQVRRELLAKAENTAR